MPISQELIRQRYYYDDGNLYYRINIGKKIKAGDLAGGLDKSVGYYVIGINGKNYLLHRMIYLYHYGHLPTKVDHEDVDPTNNKIENLRPATRRENGYNRRSNKNSSSVYKGVSWNKARNKWRAGYRHNGKIIHIGMFDNEKQAAKAYDAATKELHGKFWRPNFPE